jgi:hypothetical protein
MRSCRRGPQGGIITGISIVVIGAVLLLAQIGVLHFEALWRFWPVIFIVIGLSKLVEATAPSQRMFGAMMMFIGALLLAHYLGHFRYGIDQLWPLFVIGGGLSLIFQSYWPGTRGDFSGLTSDGGFRSVNVFGGTDRKFRDQNFKGGSVFACFGGFQLDFTQAEIQGDAALIEASAIFGGGEIRVPLTWNVIMEGSGVFGGYEDSTQHVAIEGKPAKTLVVRGVAVFGGVEVKN